MLPISTLRKSNWPSVGLKPGDIILERSGGGPKQPVGRVVYFDREDGDFSFSNFTSAVRVKDKSHIRSSRFVFYGLMELYQSGRD